MYVWVRLKIKKPPLRLLSNSPTCSSSRFYPWTGCLWGCTCLGRPSKLGSHFPFQQSIKAGQRILICRHKLKLLESARPWTCILNHFTYTLNRYLLYSFSIHRRPGLKLHSHSVLLANFLLLCASLYNA